MQARGPLMIEHRLIERMLSVIKDVLTEIKSKNKVDPVFVDIAVDFRELNNKSLSTKDRQAMNELIEDHVFGRQTTKALVDANTRYRNGNEASLAEITDKLQTLIEFYPKHIQKEDKVFFSAFRNYFTDAEDQAMLEEFWEFDRKMIHEKYKSVVEGFEKR